MSKKLTGLNPLAYLGVEAPTPPNMYVSKNTSPGPANLKGFNLGDLWLNVQAESLYVLADAIEGEAIWVTSFGGATTTFVTDSGTATDSGGVIRLIGDGTALNTTGSGNTITVNIDANPTFNNLRVNGNLDVVGATQLNGGLQLVGENNGVLVTDGSGNVSATNGSSGQILIGGGTAPAWANITSNDNSITITNGANTIDLSAPEASGATAFHTNSGTANQSAGNITIDGDGTTITTSGSGSTVTAALTNGTNGQLLIGGGSHAAWANLTSMGGTVVITNGANTINLEATGGGSSGASTFITDSGNALENLGDITFAGGHNISTSGAGQTVTLNVSGTTNHALQVGNGTGSLTSLAVATNGQLPIGSTGANPVLATLTAGSGINIVNGAGSITISAPGGGGGGGTIVTTFSTPGTYTFEKNASTKYIEVWGWCGGGGGGSGAAGTTAQGGAGGGSGSFFRFKAPSMFFGASETVVVGQGGTGGTSVTNGVGISGTDGTVSSFGNIVPPLTVNNYAPGASVSSLPQAGAGGGNPLQIAPGCGFGGGIFTDDASNLYHFNGNLSFFTVPVAAQNYRAISPHPGNGGAGSYDVGKDGYSTGGNTMLASGGGFPFLFMVGTSGAQGGSWASLTAYDGGSGGFIYALDGSTIINVGGAAGIAGISVNGENGNDKPTSGGIVVGGTGGGGGAADSNTPGHGGNGGFPGGGGGGGGGCPTGKSSGAGGNGGDGLVLVIEWT